MLAATTLAQNANWSGGAGDNDWNNALNWDIGVPAVGTNAVISAGFAVNYNAPMAAANFAGVNNTGTLNVSAASFNIDALGTLAAYMGNAASLLRVNSGGVVVATNSGAITLTTDSAVAVEGGVLVITNSTGNISFGVNGNTAGAGFTNNGGTVVFTQPFQSRGRYSRFEMHGGSLALLGGGGIFESSNDQERRFLIDGGTANLGNFSIGRTLNTVGSAGLVISNNATVNVTSLQIGTGIAASGATIYGGVLTNTGTFTISDRNNAATSGQRRVFLYVRGGTVVSTAASGIVVANQANNSNTGGSSVWGGFLDVNAGTIIAEKLTLVGPNALTNAYATLTLSGSGAIYLGSGGLVGNVGYSNTAYTMTLNGGTLGAKADYSIVGNGTLGGTLTVNAADLANAPQNITNTGVWSGSSGVLLKTGGGVLTLTKTNTYGGTTTINGGTLALGPNGAIPNTTLITVAGGATFDFSTTSAGFVLGALKTVAGAGTLSGNFTNAFTSTINPDGTLTFNGSLSQSGGAVNHFDLPTTPGPGNDQINISGDLNVSGTNIVEIVGGGSPGMIHTLFQYGGSFNGGLTNFTISGATGILSNDAPSKTISLVIRSTIRNPTNVVWVGNSTVNDWDTIVATNWLNVGTGVLDTFVTGDNVLFDDRGAVHPIVNIVGNNSPTSLTVGATANYTFGGSGAIRGIGGLTKTNTGTLTITNLNAYSGITRITGGALEATTLANGTLPSSIGAAAAASANLVLDGGTLRYTGVSVTTDRGATFDAGGGTIDVSAGGAVLTVGGTLTGDGNLTKSGAGNLTLSGANTYTNGTVINGGVLLLNNASGASTGSVTNNAATLGVNGQIVVNNALEFNSACKLDLSGVGSGNVALRGAWAGSGTVLVNFLTQNANQTLSIGGDNGSGGGAMWNFSGTLDLGTNSGFCRLNNSGTSVNFGSSNATFNLGTGNMLFSHRNGGTTTYLGALWGGPSTTLCGARGDVSGNTTYAIGGKNLDTLFEGVITNGQSGTSIRPAVIVKVGTGKLTLTGASTYTGATTIESGTLRVDGSLANTTVTVVGGNLSGLGTIAGPVEVQYGGTLSPGDNGIGQLTINNVLSLQYGSTNAFELNKSQGTSDAIAGLTGVTYGGTLVVTNLAGNLAAGDTFYLFPGAASYGGVFETLDLPALPSGLVWQTGSLLVDGSLRVVTPSGPAISGITVADGNVTLNATNGTPYGQFILFGSTNVTLPINAWIPLVTNTFDGTGAINPPLVVPMDPVAAQQFYLLQQ